jgi:myo-inositol-1(or 4)-monophosphatase
MTQTPNSPAGTDLAGLLPFPEPMRGVHGGRLYAAVAIAVEAAQLGLDFFRRRDALLVENKGPQDLVSQADREVEQLIRQRLQAQFPTDGLIGEEYGRTDAPADYTWVIDPIDGTANFVAGIPFWCVVLSCIHQGQVVLGVIVDPNTGETFTAVKGQGAWMNGQRMHVSKAGSVREGSVAAGYCNRVAPATFLRFLEPFLQAGGVFFRSASGALMLAYVAGGRLLAYHEAHIRPWDCLAGLLMIEEAGGKSWPYNTPRMFGEGSAILAGAPRVVEQMEPWVLFTQDLPPAQPS